VETVHLSNTRSRCEYYFPPVLDDATSLSRQCRGSPSWCPRWIREYVSTTAITAAGQRGVDRLHRCDPRGIQLENPVVREQPVALRLTVREVSVAGSSSYTHALSHCLSRSCALVAGVVSRAPRHVLLPNHQAQHACLRDGTGACACAPPSHALE
jgi:putative component of membrane protein insertase Oxa1/YidC/SpoIIIJ protein YidD